MPLASIPIPRLLAWTGGLYLIAILGLVLTKAPLGSRIFFASAALAAVAYGLLLARVWQEPRAPRRLLYWAFALAVAFRVPSAIAPVGADSDMVRYLWDGRVQLLGYNPYSVLPADPALAHTHTPETARMPSAHDRTPYPPGAQLFFRLIASLSDSTYAMKLALVACDILTMIVLWQWLVVTNRSEWRTLTYAWNPLVVLEVAHSGHIDALGALWIVTAAFWLTRRRTLFASVAFVLAVATKLVPIVLAPLFVGRIRVRDALIGMACLVTLYMPFIAGRDTPLIPLGALSNVVDRVRFNGPVFAAIAALSQPRIAAAFAVTIGLVAAAWARWRLSETTPAAWAWPMGLAIACAPVIYPWYLVYITPFLFTVATLPLTAWTLSALPVYVVWDLSRHGGRWITPAWVMTIEFGLVAGAAIAVAAWSQVHCFPRSTR